MIRAAEAERGMALISVLLLVAVMGALTAAILDVMNRSVAMAENGRSAMQAQHHMRAMEQLAGLRLAELTRQYPDRLTLAGGWADTPVMVPTDNGSIALSLADGSHCFNVNAVVTSANSGTWTLDPHGLEHFVGLVRAHGIEEGEARALAFALADYVDTDAIAEGAGGEDEHYQRLGQRYRTANALLADVGEVGAVKGMTPEILRRLSRHLCALPTSDMVKVNVNTLTDADAPLIAMLAPGQLSLRGARQAIAARPDAGWDSIQTFWTQPALRGLAMSTRAQRSVDVKSDLFIVDMTVSEAGAVYPYRTRIRVGGRSPRIVERSWDPA